MRLTWLTALLLLAAPTAADEIVAPDAGRCEAMRVHRVLNPGPVGCERLRLVRFSYFGFDGHLHDDGEIVVLDAVAERVAAIFAELRGHGFPIARARAMEAYDGDDEAAMADDNTSGFNVRPVAGGSQPSLHALAVAARARRRHRHQPGGEPLCALRWRALRRIAAARRAFP